MTIKLLQVRKTAFGLAIDWDKDGWWNNDGYKITHLFSILYTDNLEYETQKAIVLTLLWLSIRFIKITIP